MVSATSLGSSLDKRYQMEIAAANFRRNGQVLTSALHASIDESVQGKGKDAIRRKLTARVSPMTRQTEKGIDPRFPPLVSGQQTLDSPHSPCIKTELDVGSTAPSVARSQPRSRSRLAEKRKSRASTVIIPAKTVNSDLFVNTQDEPVSKRPRTILPRTMQGKNM